MNTYLTQFPYENIFVTSVLIWIGYYALKGKRPVNRKDFILSGLNILYFVSLVFLYFIPASYTPIHRGPYMILQPVPFRTIQSSSFIHLSGHIIIVMLVPILLRLNAFSFRKICSLSLLTALTIEPLQFVINAITRFPNFVIDIDDFILQLSGCTIGIICIAVLPRIRSNRSRSAPQS